MQLKDDHALTTHECSMGAEWDIKVFFNYTKPTKPEYQDGLMVYPGDQEGVEIEATERNEPIYDVANWVEYDGYSDSEIKDLAAEIHELINQEFIDNMGEE